MSLPFTITEAEARVFRAPLRLSTHQWARHTFRLVSGPFKGQLWNPDVTPYARGIMDAFDRKHVRKIFEIAPSQTGKSTIALICFLYMLSRRADNFGIGLPDIEAVRKYFTGRMHSYFSKVQDLRRLLAPGSDPLTNYTVSLADGSAVMGMWSGSDSSMRAESMPYVLIEEEDAYGDPTAATVMEERADAYHSMEMSKIIRVCRPKGSEDSSNIWSEAKRQAQAWCVYEARCPLCQEPVVMEHENIVAVDNTRDPARIRQENLGRFRCPHCSNLWNDSLRNMAVRGGQWVSITGDMLDATVLAFHLRQWESPQNSLSDILARWWESQGNPRAMQLWDNNVCAKPYRFVRVETDAEAIARRMDHALPRNMVPGWAVALTISCDMQMDHFYYSVAAHGLSPERVHVLDYNRVATFEDLEQIVFKGRWFTADGRELGIWRGSIDTGGTRHHKQEDSRTSQAWQWLSGLRSGVMFGTRGQSREVAGRFVTVSTVEADAQGKKIRRGQTLHGINTDAFKRIIFWRLAEGFDEEPITFHSDTDKDYFKQLASERLEKDRNGMEKWKAFAANHYLDCLVGHHALAHAHWAPSLVQLAGHGAGRESGHGSGRGGDNGD